MKISHKEISIPILGLTIASIAAVSLELMSVGSVAKRSAVASQHAMHQMQGKQVHLSQSSSNFMAAVPVTSTTVKIEGFQFALADITIKKGGKVTFTNKDSTPHTVTPDKGAKFTGTGRLAAGKSKTIVFNTVGVQSYYCEIHPSMKGKVTVVK
jgi:plastocyanin